MKIQSPKQRKTRIDFLENSSRNKKWILCDDVKVNQIKMQFTILMRSQQKAVDWE